MNSLEQILEKYGFPKRSAPLRTPLTSIEDTFSFKFPQDYQYYMLNYQGYEEEIGKQYVVLWDADELAKSNKALSVQEYLPSCFAIGGNGSGEMIALKKVGLDACIVVLTPLIGMSIEDCIEVGDSFTDFLTRLEAGRGWFDHLRKR
jgi:hypothetical protein